MKKLGTAIAAFFLFINTAKAEFLPDGCYVAFNDPYQCWEAFIPTSLQWQESPLNTIVSRYGLTTATLIDYGKGMKDLFDSSYAVNQSLISQRDQCNANFNALSAQLSANELNRQQWMAYANAQKKLVSKLRRACGTKCKKIK